ncbi:FAD/NAD(P)-binding domain-containing protein [Pluteus cervinus]|uniref:FAD/NAD(P)-binding domain-containing protein n=1 Tax=Pluteus cervinus TaxID=181527 RepID=A0ACD3B658_9AGAR|nr:FAD/NAD(P)-binding domain-containing protein [Pluteus cervinus]
MDLPNLLLDPRQDVQRKRICVIGAGPAGLAALKTVQDSPQYKAGRWTVDAYESRDDIGGVWLPAPPTTPPNSSEVPLTPLYDSLTTNLPHPLMAFSTFPFPPSTPLYPHAAIVLQYLKDYAKHYNLLSSIHLSSIVDSVKPRLFEQGERGWTVHLSNNEQHDFDLVFVCNGHYSRPRYPTTPGVESWIRTGKATHSAWYRRPHYLGKKVLILGGGPSGQDIAKEMARITPMIVHSYTNATSAESPTRDGKGIFRTRGRAVKFEEISEHDTVAGGTVTFADGSIETDIDHCILATGYETSFPFFDEDILKRQIPPAIPPLPKPNELFDSTYNVFPLARHLFPVPPSLSSQGTPINLAFLGLLVRVAPFPLVEAQARAALYGFQHPEVVDSISEVVDIVTRYQALSNSTISATNSQGTTLGDSNDPRERLRIAKAWHRFEPQEQFDYRDSLDEFASGAHQSQTQTQPRITTNDTSTPGPYPGTRRCATWEREFYMKKDILRPAWVDLEKKGEAAKWVDGVGQGDDVEKVIEEWVGVMKRLVEYAERPEHSDSVPVSGRSELNPASRL